MSRKLSGGLVPLAALALLALVWWGLVGRAGAAPGTQGAPERPTPTPDFSLPLDQTSPDGSANRARAESPEGPVISFIDSQTAQCYLPVRNTDRCYIQWNYLSVSASSSQYIISMTVTIDNRKRAYYSGFFQTSMFVPNGMHSPGFLVSCGLEGAGGLPDLGNSYAWAIRARETGGLTAANYGSVTCPADVPSVYLPILVR